MGKPSQLTFLLLVEIADDFKIPMVYFFFPETKGYSLEEVAEIFDGPDAPVGSNAIGQKKMDDMAMHKE